MPGGRLLERLLGFSQRLRALGLDVHVGRVLDLVTAFGHISLGDRDDVYLTCRAVLVHRHEDLPAFDRAFAEHFGGPAPSTPRRAVDAVGTESAAGGAVPLAIALPGDADTGGRPVPVARRTWSDVDAIARKDFAALTPDELALAKRALGALRWHPGQRRTRRSTRGRGPQVDVRRALARSVRTGGEIFRWPRRRRRSRPRPLVLLCDVSGSMEHYTRTLLHFAHSWAQRGTRVEAFVFATRLTRITPALKARPADAAIAAASRSVQDWSGGTRIGAALRLFHRHWGRRMLSGGAVVLLISDGWDRGDPAVLAEEIARLQRRSHRVIWLNPLIGTEDFAPLTRGLQAALPYVDDFLPVRTLRDVRDLALHLTSLEGRR